MPKKLVEVPVDDLCDDAIGVLARVRRSQRPVVITQRGHAAAVIVSAEAFERAETERALLRDLARGDREIAKGRGSDLDAVLEDADAYLAEHD